MRRFSKKLSSDYIGYSGYSWSSGNGAQHASNATTDPGSNPLRSDFYRVDSKRSESRSGYSSAIKMPTVTSSLNFYVNVNVKLIINYAGKFSAAYT